MRLVTKVALVCMVLALVSGCSDSGPKQPADMVFIGQHILTMDDKTAHASAVAITGENIVFVGSERKIKHYIGAATKVIRLGNQALLPGFIDAHGHFTQSARFIDMVNLSPPPVGTVTDIESLISRVQKSKRQNQGANDWILGYGYDDSLIKEHRHPTRDDLDAVSKTRPVLLIHVSFHFVAVNSVALKALGLNAGTPDPAGGRIRRREGSLEPNGILEETASHPALYRLASISPEQYEILLRKAANYYASFGITSAC